MIIIYTVLYEEISVFLLPYPLPKKRILAKDLFPSRRSKTESDQYHKTCQLQQQIRCYHRRLFWFVIKIRKHDLIGEETKDWWEIIRPDKVVRASLFSYRTERAHYVVVTSLTVHVKLSIFSEKLTTFSSLAFFDNFVVVPKVEVKVKCTYLDKRLPSAHVIQATTISRVHTRKVGWLNKTRLQSTISEFPIAGQGTEFPKIPEKNMSDVHKIITPEL